MKDRRNIDTGTDMWGTYLAWRVENQWRFIVQIRGVRCTVCMGTHFADVYEADDIWLGSQRRRIVDDCGRAGRTLGEWARFILDTTSALLAPVIEPLDTEGRGLADRGCGTYSEIAHRDDD